MVTVLVSWGKEVGSRQGICLSLGSLLTNTAVCQALVQVPGCRVSDTDQVPSLMKCKVS